MEPIARKWFSAKQKTELWERWRQGQCVAAIQRRTNYRGVEGDRGGSEDEGPVSTARERGIDVRFIQPGKPDENAFIERFNRSYREEVLSAHLFESIADVQEITDDWLRRYNENRPHDALGSLPPARYREKLLAAECLL